MADRFAGKRIAALSPGADGKDSKDLLTTLAVAAGLGGLSVTGLASLIDLFTGSANVGNSGEYLANSVISSIPAGTAVAGAGAAALMNPIVRKDLETLASLGAMQDVAAQAGRDAAMYAKGVTDQPPSTTATNVMANRVDESARQLLLAAAQQAKKEGITPQEVIARGRRQMMRGGGIGAAAGTIPALLMMRDAPAMAGSE